jgi:L-asparaginase
MKETYDLFVSYNRDNKKWVSRFVDDLKQEYKKHIGKELKVFIDVEALTTAEMWRRRIKESMEKSSGMICFLSPSYFRSKFCGWEWDYFYGLPHAENLPLFLVRILSWEHIKDFSSEERTRIKQAEEISWFDFEKIKRGTGEYANLRKKLVDRIYEVLTASITQRTNIHIINMAVTPDNITDDVTRIFGEKGEQRLHPDKEPVFVLYTGGTVGMVRSDPNDKESQLVIGSLNDVIKYLHKLRDLEFDIDFYSFEKPLDSSNIVAKDWGVIARIIESCYKHYQGFVILHGTDTMVYTASMLSFMFSNLGKPVILTGAEAPPSDINSDAEVNIINAIRLAAPQVTEDLPIIPEVCILFGRKLMRGNRAKKLQSLSMDEGFDSPNCDPLGYVGDRIDIKQAAIFHQRTGPRGFEIDKRICDQKSISKVWILEIFPNMKTKLINTILFDNDIRGVILKTYGTGNAPTAPLDFLAEIEQAVDNGKVIVNLTQCPKGHVEVRLFETNAHLFDLGVINGGDMTSEAAFCKLSLLLEKYKDDIAAVKSEMQIDLRGELTYSAYNISYSNGRIDRIFNGTPKNIGNLDPMEIDHAKLRLHDLRIDGAEDGDIRLKVLMNCGKIDEENWKNYQNHLIGNVTRYWDKKHELTHNMEATVAVKKFADPHGMTSLHIVSESELPITFGTLELSIFTRRS